MSSPCCHSICSQASSRRGFLARAAAAATAFGPQPLPGLLAQPSNRPRPKVAAIFTVFRFRSHAYDILENFFEPYLFRGQLVDPGVDVVSFYADQFPPDDMARDASRRHRVPLFASIDEALCLGGRQMAVDAVLLIGEHGDYPTTARGQKMYPRKQFFDEIVAVMRRSERFVPLFNDKHLSYRWDWAKQMYQVTQQLGIPLMAGSSVPLAQRRPPLELPQEAEIEEAVSIHGGGLESYDFHGLEVLQSFVESRRSGETGISRVELLTGESLRRAEKEGRWSRDLVAAAMDAEHQMSETRQPRPDEQRPSRNSGGPDVRRLPVSHAVVLTYQDGLKASVLKVGSSADRWNFACRLQGDPRPRATALFNGPWGNRCLFKALSHAIQHLFIHRQPAYPVQRTLLVTGVLDAAMRSHQQAGEPLDTPQLEFGYQPIDFAKMRETGETWKIITKDSPQPASFVPGDRRWVDAQPKRPGKSSR